MKMAPRVLVIGAGSIGARHVRNLLSLGVDVTSTDVDRDRAQATGAQQTIAFESWERENFDGIVVASPTVHHVEQALAALATRAKVMVEKPLACGSDDAERLAATGADRLMVGYNLRLHAPVRRLIELVHGGHIGTMLSARLWFGSWLPDWRPSVDYRTTYSARADLGGGVLLDAIHELDLAIWLCDDTGLRVEGAVVDRVGPLDINVEDTVKALLRDRVGTPVEISLDYLSHRYRRGIEVIGDRATVRLDWARAVIELEDASGVEVESATTPLDLAYVEEARRFISWITDGVAPPVDGRIGAASVQLADRIRRVSLNRRATVGAR